MKLKKKFKISDSNQVWIIKITDTDKLFIETRDTQAMKAYYHSYDLYSGKKIFSEYQMSEMFWLGIEAIKDDIVFFHRFAKPDMPGHRGVFAFDINTQKILWESEEYAFLFLKDNLMYVYQERFEGRSFYTIDVESGVIVEELGENPTNINDLRDEAERSIDYSSYKFPERYSQNIGIENIDSVIAQEIKDVKITNSVEFIDLNDLLIFNYHQLGEDKKLINKIKAFDLEKNKEVYSDILNKSANAFAPDSFFMYKNFLIILKEKMEVIIMEVKG